MPRLASPDMPPWAAHVHRALGNAPALAALAVLAARDDAMGLREVADATGLSTQTASVALQHLETLGLVVASTPAPRPRATRVTWAADRDALDALVRELDAGLGTHTTRDPHTPA